MKEGEKHKLEHRRRRKNKIEAEVKGRMREG
jgi:hypothetical protein